MPDLRVFGEDKIRGADQGGCWYLSDRGGSPLHGEITRADNIVHCDSFGEPAALHVLYRVADFGRVVLGTMPLAPRTNPYSLGLELAKAKLECIHDRCRAWAELGFTPSRIIREEAAYAAKLVKQAEAVEEYNPPRCASLAEKALTRATWAGESIALEAAHHCLNRKIGDGSSRRMLLGSNFFGYGLSEDYNRRFEELCNYATLPFYWRSFEPEPGAEQWEKIDQMLAWLQARGIKAKGHPLVWFFEQCYPPWARRNTFDELKSLNVGRVHRIVSRCRGTMAFWDVINEAHDADHANMFGLGRARLAEVTASATQAARQADSAAGLVVNVCAPFGEYAADKSGKWTPLDYLAACLRNGSDFDAIGVQFYYGSGWASCRDLLEISAQLDRYGALGKPVHVTEIGCPSSSLPDPGHYLGPATVEQAGQWHAPWSESLQAEWVEKFYTICCGKPYVSAVTWWDLADYEGHFFTHGGLLRADYTPKPAYFRLLELAKKMGVTRGL